LRGLRLSSWRNHGVASLLPSRLACRITAVAPLRSRAGITDSVYGFLG
jgi:hypothetical protein